jgi:hypothetical protein
MPARSRLCHGQLAAQHGFFGKRQGNIEASRADSRIVCIANSPAPLVLQQDHLLLRKIDCLVRGSGFQTMREGDATCLLEEELRDGTCTVQFCAALL